MSVIVNTTTLSNFACIKQLNVLQQLYKNINISVEVYFTQKFRFAKLLREMVKFNKD